jgi:hypothetical protein
MSRPADPSYVVPVFAPDANYPAGGNTWNGNPTKVAPPGATSVGFTPGQGNAAQYINKLVFDAYDTDGKAKTSNQAWAAFVGQLPALNFFIGPAVAFSDAVWNPVRRVWCAVGTGHNVQESVSAGQVFAAANLIAGIAGTSPALRIACNDATGDMVVTTDTTAVYEWSQAGAAWTSRSVSGLAAPAAGDAMNVVFDGTLWCAYIAGRGAGGTGFRGFFSSPDRATWTSRALPSSGTAAAIANGLSQLATNKAGRSVALVNLGTTGFAEFLATTDGGATWVTGTYGQVNHGITAVTAQSLKYNAASGLFIFTVASSAASKVYTSTDGLAWTLAASLGAGGRIQTITTMGELWLAQVGSASLAYSVDRGVTWRSLEFIPDTATITTLKSSGGQFLMLTSANVYPSLRMGVGGAVLT